MKNKMSIAVFTMAQRALRRFNTSVRVGLGLGLVACLLIAGQLSSAKVYTSAAGGFGFVGGRVEPQQKASDDLVRQIQMALPKASAPTGEPQMPNTEPRSGSARTAARLALNSVNSPQQTCSLQSIAIGQTISGSLAPGDCQTSSGFLADFYGFNANAGQEVSISVSSPSFGTVLFLFLGDQTVASDVGGAGGNNSRIPSAGGTLRLQSAGQYTIAVTSLNAGQTGNYNLQLSGGGQPSPSPSPGSIVPLTSGQPVQGSVVPPTPPNTGQLGDTQYTIVIPASATQLQIQLTGNQAARVYGRYDQPVTVSGGQAVFDFGGPTTASTGFTITLTSTSSPPAQLRTGTIYLRVANFGSSVLNFSLTAVLGGTPPPSPSPSPSPGGAAEQEPNDTPQQANPLSVPGTRTGSAGRNDAFQVSINFNDGSSEPIPDLFVVTLAQSSQLDLALTFTTGADLDLFLFGSDGNVINASAKDGAGVAERITTTQPLAAGSYYVGVGAFNGSSTYTLTAAVPGGGNCSYSLSQTSASALAAGGPGSVNVVTASGCQWTATANDNWLQITSGASGNGNGTVNYNVQPNTSANSRRGTLTIADKTFTVDQAGATVTSPVIDAQPNPLDFSSVSVGGTADRTLTVRNTGNATLTVTNITTSSPFSLTSGTSFNVTAGGQQMVTVRFSPTVTGQMTGTLTITSNASNSPTIIVQLQGQGTQQPPACPVVNNPVSPSSGPVLTVVTITGQNFTGVTAVRFAGGATATPTINSLGTQIQATVPSGAQTGTVNLVKAGCSDTPAGTFQVAQSGNCVSVSIAQNLTRPPGASLVVPITVGDVTGKNVTSYDFTLIYDAAVLRPASGEIADRANTLSSGFTVFANGNNSGRVSVSGFGTSPLSGQGPLLNLRFEVIGQAQACSDLVLSGFTFNNGTPCVAPTNGRVCIASGGSISGTVGYAGTTSAVPGVKLIVTGAASAMATTDSLGAYQLPNLSGGPITVTPSKADGFAAVKPFIKSFDAALVARAAVGLEQLNQFQLAAADADNNGRPTAFDAALIAKASVEIFDEPTSIVGMWKFVPDKREYPTVSGEMAGQNFTAVLVGDVNGDWRPQSANLVGPEVTNLASPSRVGQPALPAWLPNVKAAPGQPLFIPIAVGDWTGLDVTSFDLDLFYDPHALQLRAPAVLTKGTLSEGMTVVVNDTVPGRLRISAFGVTALAGSGNLLRLNFVARKAVDNVPLLFWNEFQLNAGTPAVELSVAEGTVKNVSARNHRDVELASGTFVAAFGQNLAYTTAQVEGVSTESLAGVTVLLRDGAGVEWRAPVLFVSPSQINYQLPSGMAAGVASVAIIRDGVPAGRGMLQITSGKSAERDSSSLRQTSKQVNPEEKQ